MGKCCQKRDLYPDSRNISQNFNVCFVPLLPRFCLCSVCDALHLLLLGGSHLCFGSVVNCIPAHLAERVRSSMPGPLAGVACGREWRGSLFTDSDRREFPHESDCFYIWSGWTAAWTAGAPLSLYPWRSANCPLPQWHIRGHRFSRAPLPLPSPGTSLGTNDVRGCRV